MSVGQQWGRPRLGSSHYDVRWVIWGQSNLPRRDGHENKGWEMIYAYQSEMLGGRVPLCWDKLKMEPWRTLEILQREFLNFYLGGGGVLTLKNSERNLIEEDFSSIPTDGVTKSNKKSLQLLCLEPVRGLKYSWRWSCGLGCQRAFSFSWKCWGLKKGTSPCKTGGEP